jgi:Outer membrane protein beta-barrel domain
MVVGNPTVVITLNIIITEDNTMRDSLKTLMLLVPVISGIFVAHPALGQTANAEGTETAPQSSNQRFNQSYIGAGIGGNITRASNKPNENNRFGGNIQGRLAIPNAPVSARGTFLFGGGNSAIIPTLTYDVPISQNTNLYAGAGYSFVSKDGKNTAIGNRDAFVLNAGIESQVGKNIVIYGDAKYGIKAYQNSAASPLSLSAGVGFNF